MNGKDADSSFFDADLDHPITVNRWRYFKIRGEIDQYAEAIEYGLALIGTGQPFLTMFRFALCRNCPEPTCA